MATKPKAKRVTKADGTVSIAGKAGNGEGSIYWDASKGAYRATYVDPATGKRRTVTGRTKAEAAAKRDAKVTELAEATPTGRLGAAPTVAELVAWWLANVAATSVRPSTFHTYKKDATRITEHLGSLPVAQLDAEAVRGFVAAMRRTVHDENGKVVREPLSIGTVRNARTRLRQVAAAAVDLGYLPGNPVPAVPLPKVTAEERKTRRALTPDEVHKLLGALDGSAPLDAAVALLFTSGMRVSEVLGLAWSDLDLDAGTATVRRGCTYTGGGLGARLDAPKTTGTAGVHHLAPTAVALLRARKAQQAAERLAAGPAWEQVTYEGQPIALVFTTKLGALVVRQDVTSHLRRRLDAAEVDPTGVGTHTARRSVVTALYVAGVPLDDVARHVGHASPETTARYVQDLGTRPADTARRAAALLDPAAGQ